MRQALVFLSCLAACISMAQNDPAAKIVSASEYRETDVQIVLADLFKKVDTHFTISKRAQGTVCVHLPEQRFDQTFQAILIACDLTYRVEDGVYQIIQRSHDPRAAAEPACDQGQQDWPTTPVANLRRVRADGRSLILDCLTSAKSYYVIGSRVGGTTSIDVPEEPIGITLRQLALGCEVELSFRNNTWIVANPPPVRSGGLDGY